MPLSKNLLNHIKENHHRFTLSLSNGFHFFFVLIIAAAISLGIYQMSLISSAQISFTNLVSYWGGSGDDRIRDIFVDGQGFIYVTGGTTSLNYVTTANAYDQTHNGGVSDVVYSKFTSDGILMYSTLLGGPNFDRADAVEVDSSGNVYVAGRAGSGFPTTANVVQRNFAGDNSPDARGPADGFITKFSSNGTLLWSTYFGDPGNGTIRDIALDSQNNIYLYISADADNPHITAGAYDTNRSGIDAVVAKISPNGSQVIYATYIGGSGEERGEGSVRVDGNGQAYVFTTTDSNNLPTTAGAYQRNYGGGKWDWMVAKLSANGNSAIYVTYFGGNDAELAQTHNFSVDGAGNAYIAAGTLSTNLPTSSNAYQRSHGGIDSGATTSFIHGGDGYIAKISPNGTQLLAATYLGGSRGDGIEGSQIDSNGNVYIGGATRSDNFPVTGNVFQSSRRGGYDGFITKLSADLSTLMYSTYVGGSGDELSGSGMAADNVGIAYLSGQTVSSDFPVTANAPDKTRSGDEGFFAKIVTATAPTPAPTPPPAPTPTPTPTPISPSPSVQPPPPIPDTILPVVAITSPQTGFFISLAGNLTVNISATDNVAVIRTEFYVDGILRGTDPFLPYSIVWDTTNGGTHPCIGMHNHSLTARAYDSTGNVGISPVVTVSMADPSYCFTQPSPQPPPPPGPQPPPQPPPPPPGPGTQSVASNLTLQSVPKIFAGLACYSVRFGLIAVVIAIIVSGIAFLFVHGNPTAFANTKKAFFYAIIGGLIIYGVYTIILSVSLIVTGSTNLPWVPLTCS